MYRGGSTFTRDGSCVRCSNSGRCNGANDLGERAWAWGLDMNNERWIWLSKEREWMRDDLMRTLVWT